MTIAYNRIIYPERAEYLNEQKFQEYRVFLDHWNSIASKLKSNYEEALLRSVSKSLVVYGKQSTGKTLLSQKLSSDFKQTESQIDSIEYNENNIWHRIVSGFGKSIELIKENTAKTSLLHIEDDKEWIAKVKRNYEGNKSRTCVIVLDNCERDYFIQNLVGISDEQFLQIGRTDQLIRSAAQKYVALCRNELRNALVILMTNDDLFALAFEDAVNSQHRGLVEVESLPLPDPKAKETIVRVNTNRLNPFSYWYCLDKAGIEEKKRVYRSYKEPNGFKESFESVDLAIQNASRTRVGRPAKNCQLCVFIMTDTDDVSGIIDSLQLEEASRNINHNPTIDIANFSVGWTSKFGLHQRQSNLLESEFNFKLVVASNQFVEQLMNGDPRVTKQLIDLSLRHHSPGTYKSTLLAYKTEFDSALSSIQAASEFDLAKFWGAGQNRSTYYEPRLREIYPDYNTSKPGFLTYRPDLTLKNYTPCNLTSSESDNDDNLNASIMRDANVCEFTAFKTISMPTVSGYIGKKFQNYIDVIQEQ